MSIQKPSKTEIALALAAAMLVSVERLPSRADEALDVVSLQKELTAHVQMLAGKIGARSLTKAPANLERAAAYIEGEFSKAGLSVQNDSYRIDSPVLRIRHIGSGNDFSVMGKSTRNVVATIKGTDRANEVVVIGAHYDSVFDCPGANDNGSGVAALLEIAKALAHRKLRRTVHFVAFTNEEPPFFRSPDMGSARFASKLAAENTKLVAMLSLETIGYYSTRPNSQKYPPGLGEGRSTVGDFLAFVGNERSASLVRTVSGAFKKASRFPIETLVAPESIQGIDFSDQQSFWKYGYPALMVTDTAFLRYPFYHKKEDLPVAVDYVKLAQVTRAMTTVVSSLADDGSASEH